MNFETKFCGVSFPTPLVLASGIISGPDSLAEASRVRGIGAVTWKSISLEPREGHAPPVIVKYNAGFINSVGLKNPGVDQAVKDILNARKIIKIPIIASIVAFQVSEFPILAEKIKKAKPDLIELNLSCPNVDDEIGRPFATDPLLTTIAVSEVKRVAGKIPVIAKLTPNVIDIKEVARACEDAGADGICAINTAGPGLLIDIGQRRGKLGNKIGGYSGRAVKPLALRCVWDIANTVKIPIIGMGGVNSGEDAIEMIMAGATLVGIGTALYGEGNGVFSRIISEMEETMKRERLKSITSIRKLIN